MGNSCSESPEVEIENVTLERAAGHNIGRLAALALISLVSYCSIGRRKECAQSCADESRVGHAQP